MKIHFSGIGGIGISALAQLCLSRGYDVQGSDLNKSEIWPTLETKRIPVFLQQTKDNITKDLDLLVYSEAVPEINPERIRAMELGIPQKSYFEFLGEISQEFFTVAVAGTHGKTTTTALIGSGILATGFESNIIVGTTLKEFGGSNFNGSLQKNLIVEACEYRENFRFLNPDILILTGIEWDHIDAFPTEESYFKAFEKIVQRSKVVIYHSGDKNIEKILRNFSGEVIAVPKQSDNSLEYLLQVFGEFNEQNALLALAVARKLGINLEQFKKGLGNFSGAGRRQELLGKKKGTLIYDDYAHHPSELKALLRGFRKKFPGKKLGIIFEPHQFSRTKQFFSTFVEVLQSFDIKAFYPIYAARDTEEDKKFNLESELKEYPEIEIVNSHEKVSQKFKDLSESDVLIFAGAGNISAFAHEYVKK